MKWAEYAKADTEIHVNNKAAEMLRRTLPQLQPGSVFGVVVPQTILHGTFAEEVRRYLIEHFELREVSLFPDKVFSFSDAESAVLLAGGCRKNREENDTSVSPNSRMANAKVSRNLRCAKLSDRRAGAIQRERALGHACSGS